MILKLLNLHLKMALQIYKDNPKNKVYYYSNLLSISFERYMIRYG